MMESTLPHSSGDTGIQSNLLTTSVVTNTYHSVARHTVVRAISHFYKHVHLLIVVTCDVTTPANRKTKDYP